MYVRLLEVPLETAHGIVYTELRRYTVADNQLVIDAPNRPKGYGGGKRGKRYGQLPPPGKQRNRVTRAKGRKTGKGNR